MSTWLFLVAPVLASAGATDGAPVELKIEASPAAVVLSERGSADVALSVVATGSAADSSVADILLDSTAGQIEGLRQVGPGLFRALLRPPAKAFPQVVVVTAVDRTSLGGTQAPRAAVAVVSYSARIPLTGSAEPASRMTLRVGGGAFGPVLVGPDGRFRVEVVVPPGETWAQSESVDAIGNRFRAPVNLYLPTVERVHARAYPTTLVANGRDAAWLLVTTVGRSGQPERYRTQVDVSRGTVGAPVALAEGLVAFKVVAPVGVGDGVLPLTLRVAHDEPRRLPLGLMAGAPSSLEVRGSPAPSWADGATEAVSIAILRDAMGEPALGYEVVAEGPNGQRLPLDGAEGGVYSVSLGTRATATQERWTVTIAPTTSECERARLWQGDLLHVVDPRGVPCVGAFIVRDAANGVIASGELGPRGELPASARELVGRYGLRLELQPRGRPASAASSAASINLAAAPFAEALAPVLSQVSTVTWPSPPPVQVSLRVVEQQGSAWLVEASTPPRDTGTLVPAVSAGTLRVESESPSRTLLWVSHVGATRVWVTDRESGVTSWLDLR